MNEPKVIRSIITRAVITDKTGAVTEGMQVGMAEICGNGELDGQPFYLTTDSSLWPKDQLALFGAKVRQADVSVDYAVWEVTYGDNEQYKTMVYPGDLIVFYNGKIIPIVGEQVKLFYDVVINQVEVRSEQNAEEHSDKTKGD